MEHNIDNDKFKADDCISSQKLVEIYKNDIARIKADIKKGKKRISRFKSYIILELEKILSNDEE